jgi:hypothetical protein
MPAVVAVITKYQQSPLLRVVLSTILANSF